MPKEWKAKDPNKPDALKQVRHTVGMLEGEWKDWKRAAKRASLTLWEWIRAACNEGAKR